MEESGTVDIHVLMDNLNAGRQRVAAEKAERETAENAERGAAVPKVGQG